MRKNFWSIDIRRSYEFDFEGQSNNLEIQYCITHTYTFQTDEGYRYVLLVDIFDDINLFGLKFHKAEDFESKYKYNVLTNHKNPLRFFATILCILKEIVKQFPQYSLIFICEPTIKEIEDAQKINKNAYQNTKRFRFYKKLLGEMINSNSYEYKENEMKSIILLVNKEVVQENFDEIENYLKTYGFHL